jgi:hypothetical protein
MFTLLRVAMEKKLEWLTFPPSQAPNIVKPVVRRFSFMLHEYNGRLQLDQSLAHRYAVPRSDGQRPIPGTCAGCFTKITGPSFKCTLGCGVLCAICVRTLTMHRGHQKCTTEERRSVQQSGLMPFGSFCNGCGQTPLTTPFYHCMVCVDYDLCATCEELNDKFDVAGDDLMLHTLDHVMVKYRQYPTVFPTLPSPPQ